MPRRKLEFARHLRRSMTHAEAVLWSQVRNRRLGDFKIRRQVIVSGFIADFYCPEVKLVIEVDGEIHLNEELARRDARREKILRSDGFVVIRFTNPDVIHHTDRICRELLERLTNLSIQRCGPLSMNNASSPLVERPGEAAGVRSERLERPPRLCRGGRGEAVQAQDAQTAQWM